MNKTEPVCIADIEEIAKSKLPEDAFNFYQYGSDQQQTLSENKKAFNRLRIRPRLLRAISLVDTTCYILGQKIKTPICVAPTGIHKVAHPVGECGTARVTGMNASCMIVSSWSSTEFEDIAEAAPNTTLWRHTYFYNDKNLTIKILRRMEESGYKAIVLTVDTTTRKHNKYQKMKNLLDRYGLSVYNDADVGSMVKVAVSWTDIDWLRTVTKLQILLKGIITKEDALEALKHDVQGIIVSNHGGRQLDGVSSTIEALPEIVEAVNGKIEVYLDGGIRRGTDVFKALALGAKAVFIGRPVIYGLAYKGEEGVKKVFQLLKDELERAMLLAGCASLADITPDMVVHESYYWTLPSNKL